MYAQIAELKTLVLFSQLDSVFRKLSDVEIEDAKEIVAQQPTISVNNLLHAVVRKPEPAYQTDRI